MSRRQGDKVAVDDLSFAVLPGRSSGGATRPELMPSSVEAVFVMPGALITVVTSAAYLSFYLSRPGGGGMAVVGAGQSDARTGGASERWTSQLAGALLLVATTAGLLG